MLTHTPVKMVEDDVEWTELRAKQDSLAALMERKSVMVARKGGDDVTCSVSTKVNKHSKFLTLPALHVHRSISQEDCVSVSQKSQGEVGASRCNTDMNNYRSQQP